MKVHYSRAVKVRMWLEWHERVMAGESPTVIISEYINSLTGRPYTYQNFYHGMKRLKQLQESGELKNYLLSDERTKYGQQKD